jgi:hypothetical protein
MIRFFFSLVDLSSPSNVDKNNSTSIVDDPKDLDDHTYCAKIVESNENIMNVSENTYGLVSKASGPCVCDPCHKTLKGLSIKEVTHL